MNRKDLLSEIRKIEIASRNSTWFSLSGNYRSVLKGSGMEIAGFKEYSPDDDYRAVDWNVTARSGKVYSRIYQEEREIPLFFIVDTSYSMYTGGSPAGRKTKIEAAAVAEAVLAFSAVFNNDRAGSVFCSDTVEDEKRIGGKASHIAGMIFSLLDHSPEKPFFNIKYALSCIPRSMKRGCCFVISDFKTDVPSGILNAAGRKTDLVFIRITDPSDRFNVGRFSFCASDFSRKKNSLRYISLSGKSGRLKREIAEKHLNEQKRLIIKEGIPVIDISTEDNIPAVINRFFQKRRI